MRLVTWNVNGLRPRVREAAAPLGLGKPPTQRDDNDDDDSAAASIAAHVGGADLLALQEAKLTTAQLTRGFDGDDAQFARRVCCFPRSGAQETQWSACMSLHPTRGYAGVTTYARAEPVRAAEGLTPHPPRSTCLATRPIAVPSDAYTRPPPEERKVWCGCSGIGPDGTPQATCPRLVALLHLDPATRETWTDVNSEGRAVMSVHRIVPTSTTTLSQGDAPLPPALTLFNLYAPNESRGERVPFKLSFFTALHRALVAAASTPSPPIVVGDLNLVASAADQASSQEWSDQVEQAALRALLHPTNSTPYDDDGNGDAELDVPPCQCNSTPKANQWCWCSIALAAYCAAACTVPSRLLSPDRPSRSLSSTTAIPEPSSELDRFPSYIGSLLSRIWYHSITRGSYQLLIDLADQLDGTPPAQPSFTCWSIKYDLRRSNYGCRLDYVLAHPSLARWAVVDENGVRAKVLDTPTGSDHAPVAVQFGFELDVWTESTDSSPVAGDEDDPWLAKDVRLLPKNWPTFLSRGTITTLFAQAAQKAATTPSSSHSITSHPTATKPVPTAPSAPPAPPNSFAKKAKSSTTKQMSMKQFFGRPPAAASTSKWQRMPSTPPIPSSCSSSTVSFSSSSSTSIPTSSMFNPPPPLDPALYESVESTHKVDPDAQRAWSQLLQPRPAPKCWHGEPARQAKVSKPGKNKGKTFWFCARPLALGPGTITTTPFSSSHSPPANKPGDAAAPLGTKPGSSVGPTQCGFFRWR